MLPLLICAIEEVVEDVAEHEIKSLAGDLKDKILKSAGLDQAEVLADEEAQKLMQSFNISDISQIRAIEANIIAKINDNLSK
jgi:hypothetical protein